MPRIDDAVLRCVFYLYPTRAAAEAGLEAGGTGFIVGVRSAAHPDIWHGYGVTNKHVACSGGSSVIRLSAPNGRVEIFEHEPHEWIQHPAGDDLALIWLPPGTHVFESRFIEADSLIDQERARKANIGPGDDVFMVGRFIRHDGKETNAPSVRFGNISMQPMPIMQPSEFLQESYAVEMRSMPGYSGSPVFMYRLTGSPGVQRIVAGHAQVGLLGVNWGFISDKWEVVDGKSPQGPLRPGANSSASFVRANTGMNGVVPSWKILEILALPQVSGKRTELDEGIAQEITSQRGETHFSVAKHVSAAASDGSDWLDPAEAARRRDETLRRMLSTPPKPQRKS